MSRYYREIPRTGLKKTLSPRKRKSLVFLAAPVSIFDLDLRQRLLHDREYAAAYLKGAWHHHYYLLTYLFVVGVMGYGLFS